MINIVDLGIYDIISKVFLSVFGATLMATPTFSILSDIAFFALGFYFIYFILIKPFVIFSNSLKSWGVKK